MAISRARMIRARIPSHPTCTDCRNIRRRGPRVNCHSPSDTSSAVEFLAWHMEVAVQKRIFVLNLRVPVDGPLPQGEVKVANPVRKRPCVWRIVDFGRTGSRSADLLTVPTLPSRANDH